MKENRFLFFGGLSRNSTEYRPAEGTRLKISIPHAEFLGLLYYSTTAEESVKKKSYVRGPT